MSIFIRLSVLVDEIHHLEVLPDNVAVETHTRAMNVHHHVRAVRGNSDFFRLRSVARASPSRQAIASATSGEERDKSAEAPRKLPTSSLATAAMAALLEFLDSAASTFTSITPRGGGIQRGCGSGCGMAAPPVVFFSSTGIATPNLTASVQ